MKKTLAVLTVFLLIISFCSCASPEPDKNNVDERLTGQSDERSTESKTVSHSEKVEKGANSGTADTYTGLKPLAKRDFTVTDPDNSRALSTKKVCHSFGVASGGKANDISVNFQKYFDEKKFDAVTLDTVTKEKVMYLTFDCGYENGYTMKILDTLKEKNVPAAFFCTLHEMKENPDIISRAIKDGHIVGNHTDTHPSMDELSRTKMAGELKAFDDYLREHFGYSAEYFRFPKGEYSDCALDLVSSLGYTSVFWSLAYSDWDLDNQKGADYATETVTYRFHPGAIILLHSVSPDNAAALGDIIDNARAEGYEFRALTQLPERDINY